MGASPKGRKDLADKAGISGDLILKWVNRADLYRVKGIGQEYSDLLEAAGVDTVVELAQRKAENLYAKLVEVNTAKKLVRQLPTQAQVSAWVDFAKKLPRAVTLLKRLFVLPPPPISEGAFSFKWVLLAVIPPERLNRYGKEPEHGAQFLAGRERAAAGGGGRGLEGLRAVEPGQRVGAQFLLHPLSAVDGRFAADGQHAGVKTGRERRVSLDD